MRENPGIPLDLHQRRGSPKVYDPARTAEEKPMQLPLQITFRHMATSPAVAARIRRRVAELERFYDRITSCRVVVECRHRRHQQGNLFGVRIDLTVPGREIVVGRDPAARHAHEDVHVAVRDAFDAARRLLEDHAREGRGAVKLHAVPDHGRIQRLLPDRDCGFILATDGNELYFHRNSVAGGLFDQLEIGDEVRFVAQHSESAAGPQASTVVLLGKHRLAPLEAIRA
jgi:ribosome-associated translation inhibitor RaiA/cold shock CspA family protein